MVYELRVTCLSEFDINEAKKLGFRYSEDGVPLSIYDEDYKKVFIEINSLEELQNFIEKYGKVVVTKTTIEIYNGWRE